MFKSSNSMSIYSSLSQWIPTINATAREWELACIIIANRFDNFVIMPPSYISCLYLKEFIDPDIHQPVKHFINSNQILF